MKEIVNCAAYSVGRKTVDIDLDKIHEALKDPNQFVWIGLYEPSEAILERVQQEFGLHDLAVEDAHRAHQRPKIEVYGDSLFIVLRTAQMESDCHIRFGETHFFVGPNYILVVRHGSSVAYTEVRSRCESMPELMSKGQGFVLYAIMDFIVDMYFPVVEQLEDAQVDLEDNIFRKTPSRETTEEIYNLKKDLLEVKRAVSPFIDICNRLMRFDIKCISPETQPYFRDIYDHALRLNEIVDNTMELLNTALDANFSLISIDQNDTSRKFAAWAAILAVPTLIAGFYGMNFSFMPELHWKYGYPLVICLTISICATLYYLFRKAHWL
ncbi:MULTISPECIES: magnesium/cobalt transporter CorA [Niastella]|uniref:Magnesium transport protein CorA n=1 Tax=Niastella soli TaxID=2821487 RepID=A0ABS3Z4R4_9BACT|nr:magnesium/cobalt transporter CorA [Niastella soli]MBO9205160.1 magnesium/cobalt transporter CorA [Niastella soli]